MSLHESLAAFKSTFFESTLALHDAHCSVADTHQRATDKLIETNVADRKKGGNFRPGLVLKDLDHRSVGSGKFIANGPMVLWFYRGMRHLYCRLDLQAVQPVRPDIVARGASLMALSPRNEVNSRQTIREICLSFPILGDSRGELLAVSGLRVALLDYLIDLCLSEFGTDLSSVNDNPSRTLPMPQRFRIDNDCIIGTLR